MAAQSVLEIAETLTHRVYKFDASLTVARGLRRDGYLTSGISGVGQSHSPSGASVLRTASSDFTVLLVLAVKMQG